MKTHFKLGPCLNIPLHMSVHDVLLHVVPLAKPKKQKQQKSSKLGGDLVLLSLALHVVHISWLSLYCLSWFTVGGRRGLLLRPAGETLWHSLQSSCTILGKHAQW